MMFSVLIASLLVIPVTHIETAVDSQLDPAVRGKMIQVTPTLPPPVELNPDNLTGCAEMDWYRNYVGLPEVFNGLGWRESNCRNDVRTFCCYGYWQEYISLWLSTKSTYRDALVNRCGISGVGSIYGNSSKQKLAQSCAAKAVYDISGLGPWKQ